MTKISLTNSEPITWACECGQMNLMSDITCFACAGERSVCWDEHDKNRVIWEETSEGYKIVGFTEDKRP